MKIDETAESDHFEQMLSNNSLGLLNDSLTSAMTQQRHMALIKGDRLNVLINRIVDIATKQRDQSPLVALAILGRLSAVARGREEQVLKYVHLLIEAEPPPIDSLSDGDEKYYAALTINYANKNWVNKYCIREALTTDTAEKARKELLNIVLSKCSSAAVFFEEISIESDILKNVDSGLKKTRRILSSIRECLAVWRGQPGEDVGNTLSTLYKKLVNSDIEKADESVLFELEDQAILVLLRIIELRFSYALHAATYSIVEQGKRKFGSILWSKYLNGSVVITDIRNCVLEASLVLARQGKTDKSIIDVLLNLFSSREQLSIAISKHFNGANDLEPLVREWWVKGGAVSTSQREAQHKVGNSEDEQIGSLLIEVESSKEAMEKLRRAVVPLLQISDPILAATVDKAAAGYLEISQIARRLARMRKLSKTETKGEVLEYNPLEHEMLGGHRPGIRKVKVVREAIQKEFGGKVKTLVKARVEEE